MRILLLLLRKEFKQIMRNKSLLPLIFIMPIVQLIVIPLAADYEIKNINISIIDHDRSTFSETLRKQILASGYFRLIHFGDDYQEGLKEIENDHVDLILEIPPRFEEDLIREKGGKVFIALNAINGVKASLGGSYLSSIIKNYNESIRIKLNEQKRTIVSQGISVQASNWYNPNLNYSYFMVPGILVILVTLVGSYMCSLNIVKEKEIGTIEQINVTPIKKYQFILGKLIPFWLIGMFVFTLGLLGVGNLLYGIVPLGNLLLLYVFLSLYLVAILGMGLLISNYSNTQQQAMSVAFFFLMIFLLMSGLFTSLDSMPAWSQFIAHLIPTTYFIEVIRMIVLKGSGFEDLHFHFLVTIFFAILLNSWAIISYKKTT